MGRKVKLIESTLRDGQQSWWATRMTTAMLLPALPALDRAGFHAIEVFGQAVMDASVRYLKENPWDRFRLIRARVLKTPLMMINGGLGFSVGRGAMPDDMLALYYKACAQCGVDMFFVLDGMNDLRNLDIPIRAAKQAGKQFYGSIVYSISPVHTDAHFIEKTRQLVQKGVDALVLKDPNGVLTPDRVRSLVPAMCEAASPVPVYCHSHCVTGLGPATNLEAVKYGADALWTCTRSLANGSSLPATDAIARHLERSGYGVGLDPAAVAEVEAHFRSMAERHHKPVGTPAEYDPAYYVHQMPGGMISNFRAHLAQLGIQDRLEEVLEECPRVREDVGWVQMVTPFSQIIGTQAALNVLYGRYKVVIRDIEKLVTGYYGQTPAPPDPNLVDRASSRMKPITERAAAHVPPAVDRFRREHGPFESDEELLLAYFFMPAQLREMADAGPISEVDAAAGNSLVELVREAARRKDVTRFHYVQQA